MAGRQSVILGGGTAPCARNAEVNIYVWALVALWFAEPACESQESPAGMVESRATAPVPSELMWVQCGWGWSRDQGAWEEISRALLPRLSVQQLLLKDLPHAEYS